MVKSRRLFSVTLRELREPRDGYRVFLRRYWVAVPRSGEVPGSGDEWGLLFFGYAPRTVTPQCSESIEFIRSLTEGLYAPIKAQPLFVPVAYIPCEGAATSLLAARYPIEELALP